MDSKHDNFVRIASNRTKKLIDMMRSLQNFANTSFYEFSEEELAELIGTIEAEWFATKNVLRSVNESKTKKEL